jgi:hypothetical protein
MPKIGTALGPRSILGCLLSLSACNMEAIGGGRKDGVPTKEIVRPLDHSRQLVRQVIQGERQHSSRTRRSSLDLLLPVLRSNVPRLLKPSAQRACRVFANASNRSKSLLEALAEARTIVPVLSPEPTIRRDL